jgi:cytochrome c553
MMITRKTCAKMRISLLFMLIVPAWAGAQDMLKMCIDCHGDDGLGTESDMPIIAGEVAVIQEDAIYAYADGDRQCVSTPMMCKIASRLTEKQIIEYSAHFAQLPYKAAREEFDAALAEAGQTIHANSCAKCHGADDPSEADDSIGASKLHGQRKDYLRYALERYLAGERNQLPAMEKVIAPLSADDIEALVNYYASYRD